MKKSKSNRRCYNCNVLNLIPIKGITVKSVDESETILVTETIIKGYRVKVEYAKVSDEEMKAIQNNVTRIIAKSIIEQKKKQYFQQHFR